MSDRICHSQNPRWKSFCPAEAPAVHPRYIPKTVDLFEFIIFRTHDTAIRILYTKLLQKRNTDTFLQNVVLLRLWDNLSLLHVPLSPIAGIRSSDTLFPVLSGFFAARFSR